ncbi:MAG: glycosyltransferase family 1 protein [Spirochaetae bacterium HGW-Spirochaetae-2]|jgi:glycosyltransferase involved in cell wall biosynthesis|nr:MAG: glycosyltransferase family 1 protein [Spirochaetae bacterium HGW-Spirochaetae-2]
MRILHVLGGLDRGGAEVMVMNLYRHIDRTRIQFDFVIHTPNRGYYEEEIEALGGIVYRVPRFTGFNILTYIKAWKTFFQGNRAFSAVHGHIGSSAAIYLAIAKGFRLFTIAHSHGAGNTPDFKGLMYSFFSFPTRFIADYFFACSRAAGLSRFGKNIVDSHRFTIVKNAIVIEEFGFSQEIRTAFRAQLHLGDKFVLGHVGRFDPLKNHTFLLEVFKLVHESCPDSILLLVGDGEERSHIERAIDILGLTDSVILLGSRSDVSSILQAMDVFVFPSIAEGLGISLIEAQATGLPCVVSRNVPSEAKITNLVDFLSLRDNKTKWATAVLEKRITVHRESHHNELIEYGYDIHKMVSQLEKFYMHKGKSYE